MIDSSWDFLFKRDDFKKFLDNIDCLYTTDVIYPKKDDLFNTFKNLKYDDVKVVILGQDPYHGENEAHGLSFSVYNNVKMPPSLRNIYKELNSDLGIQNVTTDLTKWNKEGVLLLNSILTVEKDSPLSHSKIGWEYYTDLVIKELNKSNNPIVFILWGNFAKKKKEFITNSKHLVIEGVHPSPLSASRGFFGSKPFSKTNNFLKENGITEINWKL